MMKIIKKSVLYLCVLLIIATGFFMPELVSKGIDYGLHNKIQQMENKAVSLVFPESEEDNLNSWIFFNQIISDPYSTVVEISEKLKIYHLTYDKIKAISDETLTYFGFNHNDYEKFEAVPNLFISSDDNTVAVYWRCRWINKKGSEQIMWIDDNGGKMVGLLFNGNMSKTKTESDIGNEASTSDSDIPESIRTLSEYCKENYQTVNVNCRKEMENHYVIEMIVKENGYELIYPIPVDFEENNYLIFNV